MSDYFDKITAADLNDEEVIIEDELSHNDKTFTEWFNRVTDATNEDGKPKWEMLFHINANIKVKTATSMMGVAKIIQYYKKFKKNIELITDEEYDMLLSIGWVIRESIDYTADKVPKEIMDTIHSFALFNQLPDSQSSKMIIRNSDIFPLDSKDIVMSVNLSFVMNPPKTLNVRKMLMLFETINNYHSFVQKTIKTTIFRPAIYYHKYDTVKYHYWETVDGQTSLEVIMNIGNLILRCRQNNTSPLHDNVTHLSMEYQRALEKIFRHTSADNIWNNFIPAEAIIGNYFDYMTSSTVRERWVKYNQWMY